jgi:hypothetical protein
LVSSDSLLQGQDIVIALAAVLERINDRLHQKETESADRPLLD